MSKEEHSDSALMHAMCRAHNAKMGATPLGSKGHHTVDGEQFKNQVETGRWMHVGQTKTPSQAERMNARKNFQFMMKDN